MNVAMKCDCGADVRRDCKKRGADREALGLRCLDDHVLFAVDDRSGIFEREDVRARSGRVRGDGFVAQVDADPTGARVTDDTCQEQRRGDEWQVGIALQIAVVI